ncbi:MAG: hypothetical protein R3E90_01315 [Marinicella sp.]|nr:hypothetical protein [Xanthomonadales bacterium]
MKQLLYVLLAMTSSLAFATPGQYQINQACAEVGCFAGDDPNTSTIEISQSAGTFILTSNLTVSTNGAPAILVDAGNILGSGVTIDLNGFQIRHSAVADSLTNGIEVIGQNSVVTIKNGKIQAFNDNILAGDGASVVVENMVLRIARDDAIQASIGIIRNNVFDANDFGVNAPGSVNFSADRLRIENNLFIDDAANQNVAYSLGNTNYCKDNVIAYAEPDDAFSLCTLVGENLCDNALCTTSQTTSQDEAKE